MRAAARFFAPFGVSLLVAFAAVDAVVVTVCRAGPDADGLTRAQEDEVVRAHNAWRQRVGASALRWAADLAARAQARAEYLAAHGCVIEHGHLPADVGENLYYVGPLHAEGRKNELVVVTATQVVDAWGAESADYSPVHDTCAWGRQCGHYTQIVWAATEEVGCGMSVCPTLGQVWVCNYRPAGNIRILKQPASRPRPTMPPWPSTSASARHIRVEAVLLGQPGACPGLAVRRVTLFQHRPHPRAG